MIKILFFLLLTVFSCNGYYIKRNATTKKSKIVGGVKVDISDVPYLAQVTENFHQTCGATIISNAWLLTAAHCMTDNDDPWILTGSSAREQGLAHEVAYSMIHKDYNETNFDNDIALIRLVNPIKESMYQKPIKISSKPPSQYQEMKICGFGKVGENLPVSPVLRGAHTPVIPIEECKKKYLDDDPVTDNMFCAGNGQTDGCTGDSGGPGVINNELVGISSSGVHCGSKQYPGVYTLVYNYRDWISINTKIKL